MTSRKILLPFYHAVSDDFLPHVAHLYPIRDRATFIQDLDYLCKYYTPVAVDEISEIVNEQKHINRPVFHLSFDDGLSEIYSLIAPILEEKGIPATIFVNSAFTDNKALFYRYKVSLLIDTILRSGEQKFHFDQQSYTDHQSLIRDLLTLGYHDTGKIDALAVSLGVDAEKFLLDRQPYLTTPQLQDLQRRGFAIGAHSIDHPAFNEINPEEQKRQVTESFKALKALGVDQKYFSFPFSDEGVKKEFFEWLFEIEKCTLSFGISGLKDDVSPYHLHRLPMEGSYMKAEQLIKAEYLYFLIKRGVGKNTIKRK